MIPGSEKPWYTPAVVAFLSDDVPRLLKLPPAAFARDVIRLERRLTCEGESFLTKTLPALGKAIDQALQGHVPLVTHAFKKCGKTALPVFLRALHRRVFEDTGWLRTEPCIVSIRLLRQVCFWCKKIEKGYSDESLQQAVNDYKDVDKVLPERDAVLESPPLGIARAIIERMFSGINSLYTTGKPKHGSGAVASGASVVDKRKLAVKYRDLELVFRPIPWFRSLRDATESLDELLDRRTEQFGLSRTEFVEKDSLGPRTIDLMPEEYMWIQQAIMRWMYNHIENFSLAKGHVNFENQEINRNLALYPDDWITLDLSKASARNSYALVRTLFEKTAVWRPLHASRTPGTVLPGGEVLMYKAFAPMGSAVCFPVQACVYYALACAALHIQGVPLTLTFSLVYVYGDDLIVPPGYTEAITKVFEDVGLRFNPDKCCTHGKFRESCGMDAYNGVSVTPIRMRKVYQTRQHSVIPSIVEHANSLTKAGYWAAAVAFRRAALARDPKLRNLRLPYTTDERLPILAWLHWELDTVRRVYKNSIPYVVGVVFRPKGLEANAADEARYLRESLSLGGPVGELRHAKSMRVLNSTHAVPPNEAWPHFIGPVRERSSVETYHVSRIECRVLTAKYSGSLRRKAIPYWPSCQKSIVAEQVERFARFQLER